MEPSDRLCFLFGLGRADEFEDIALNLVALFVAGRFTGRKPDRHPVLGGRTRGPVPLRQVDGVPLLGREESLVADGFFHVCLLLVDGFRRPQERRPSVEGSRVAKPSRQ